MSTAPGTIRESSPILYPRAEGSSDGSDLDHYMESDAETSVEQPNPTPSNPHITKYDPRQNTNPFCNDENNYYITFPSHYDPWNAYVRFPEILGTCYESDMQQNAPFPPLS